MITQGMDKMKKIHKKFKISKSYIGMILSLLILDFGFRFILSSQIDYDRIGNISSILFSLSFIFLTSGLLSFITQKYRKAIYLVVNSLMIIITYFEYLFFQKEKVFLSLRDLFNHNLFKGMSYTDYKIILVIILSLLVSVITVYIMNKEISKRKDKIDILITVLIIIILVGGTRGVATMLLGKKVVTNNKIIEDVPKNIYLYNIDNHKKMMITGLYEYFILEEKDYLISQFNENQKRIQENYE